MKVRELLASVALGMALCAAFGTCAAPLRGPEAWLEFMGGNARKGRNSLRIEVSNTWRNRVIYDLGQPEKNRRTWMLYRPQYNPGPEDPFIPSGILGPIHIKGLVASQVNLTQSCGERRGQE